MTIEEIVQKLINGETVCMLSKKEKNEVRTRLRNIKKNCDIVLGQLHEELT